MRCPESRTLFENHLYSDSYKSEIVVFSPAANCSIVARVGLTWSVTMSPIVDRGTPVIIAACRIDRWCCSRNSDNNIFILLSFLYTAKNIQKDKKQMDGYQYEHHCAKLLKQRGFRDVAVTKSSGDQGIDVIAYNENVKYGIQCKYYSYPVGNQAVQQAYAGAKFYDCNVAVVMTNSTFTEPAKELAQKLGVQLWEKSYIPNGNGSLYKIIRAINVIFLLVSIFGFWLMKGSEHSATTTYNYFNIIVLTIASVIGLLYYRSLVASVFVSLLYLIFAISQIIFSVVHSNFSTYEIVTCIPAILYMIHTVRLLSEPLSEEEKKIIANKNKPEKTPTIETDKLELNRKIQDNLYHLGDLYVPILNEKLHSTITLKNALQTENGYLFVYISDKPISFDLSAIETEFNINLQDYYQIRPISNTEFQILQREK